MSRSTLYLGGSALGAQVVPIDAGDGVYGASGSVLFKNCAAIPVDNTDLTNKKYVDDTITAVINNIEGLGNVNPTALASITALVGDQSARGSILNNALVIQAIENTLGMDIADNLGPGATGEPVNTQFIPSLLRNSNKLASVTDFSLNAFLALVRDGELDDKVPNVDQPTLADHLSNLYSINTSNDEAIKNIISADGTLPTRNSLETIDGQLGDLYSKLTGDFSGDTTITSRQANENVDAQLGDLYLQLAGDSNGATLTTRVGSENVDAQLGDLYSNLTGNPLGAVLSTRQSLSNVDAQLGNLYSQLTGDSAGLVAERNSNANVDDQLGNLYSQLAGASTTLTSRQNNTNVNAQLGNLYSQLSGDSVGSIVTRAGNTNVNSQLSDLYYLISGSYTSFASGNLTSNGRYTGLYNADNSVDAQLGFLFLRLEQLYTYFLEQDLSTAPA